KAVPTGREGSSPSLATGTFRGRLTVGRRALNPSTLVRPQPPDLDALVVKRTSHDSPKVEAQVRLLAGVLTTIPRVWRRHAALRRGRSCRFASCQGYCGRPKAAAGPGREPGVCGFDSHRPPCRNAGAARRPGTALVRRRVWVRVPPPALIRPC